MTAPIPMLARGAFVRLTFAGRTVSAFVALASPNGRSLVLMFEANLGGYMGALPLLWDGDAWHEIFFDRREARLEVLT